MLNALAVNVIIIWIILEAGKEQTFLDVIAVAVNVIMIWLKNQRTLSFWM
jgi:hypothetical protein